MNVVGNSEMETLNVETMGLLDPLQELLSEGLLESDFESEELAREPRLLVQEASFPDQSMHILDLQLSNLREKLSRLKFYITDIDDLLPR